FAFDHFGPDFDVAYKGRKSYKIGITWSLNRGINVLNWQTDSLYSRAPIWNTVTMNRRTEIPPSKFRLLFAE
ncbi:hypothetical protein QBC45DRAFT_295359, partial [Copromyces sp. CBS 386.78]